MPDAAAHRKNVRSLRGVLGVEGRLRSREFVEPVEAARYKIRSSAQSSLRALEHLIASRN